MAKPAPLDIVADQEKDPVQAHKDAIDFHLSKATDGTALHAILNALSFMLKPRGASPPPPDPERVDGQ